MKFVSILRWLGPLGLGATLLIACDSGSGTDGGVPQVDAGAVIEPGDADGDGIGDEYEGRSTGRDTDGDGQPDFFDEDSDNDRIPDIVEGGNPGGEPRDSDGDGTPNYLDLDSDNNMISDRVEGGGDVDADGLPDNADSDNDGDFLSDIFEIGPDPEAPLDNELDGIADYNDPDSDNDLIHDAHEGELDTDMDGTPDRFDRDSDGDSIPDRMEAGDDDLTTPPVDTDDDDVPDYRDADSDADGLSDRAENMGSSDPYSADSDSDGTSDLVEVAAGTNPLDPADNPGARGDFVFVVPFEEAPAPPRDTLDFATDLQVADVYFLMDNTGSMRDSIVGIQTELRDNIIPGIRAEIPDVNFGLGGFRDYPCCGMPTANYGSGMDQPFFHLQDMTNDATVAADATAGYMASGGEDGPESHGPALWALSSGRDLPGGGSTVPIRMGCGPGTYGYACFREEAVPIIVLITDIGWHNGPGGTAPYDDLELGGHAPTYDEVVTQLNSRNMRVVGISQFGGGRPELQSIARDTRAVDATGAPLVTNFVGGSITTQIVGAISTLANATDLDISLRFTDDPADAVDSEAAFLDHLEATTAGDAARGCPPLPGIDTNADTFPDTFPTVRSGARVCFDIVVRMNTTVEGLTDPQLFRATLQVIGDGFTPLGESRDIFFLVPPLVPEPGGPD